MTSTAHKDKDGNIEWLNEKGQLHRENGPAVEYVNGRKDWCLNGLLHRKNGPAIEWPDGRKDWFHNGQIHRENGPAVEWANGSKEWWVNGQLHRENGPAVEYANGDIKCYLNGQTSPEIEQQVKENMARIQAQKDQQELFGELLQDPDISAKINTSSPKSSKKL